MMRGILIILTLAGLSSFAVGAQTASVTLAWVPSLSTNMVGYDVYYGTSCSNFTSMIDVSNVAEVAIQGLTNGTTYYFAVRTYDDIGNLSPFSLQISYVVGTTSAIPPAIMSPCATACGNFSFSVSGTPGFQYGVEASSDLANWVLLGIVTAPFKFVDINANGFGYRFYRAVYDTNIVANTAVTAPPLTSLLTSAGLNAFGQFGFTGSGTLNYPYAIEASTDLVNWIIVTTNDAPFNFVDPQASQFSQRFYRAVPAFQVAPTSTSDSTTHHHR